MRGNPGLLGAREASSRRLESVTRVKIKSDGPVIVALPIRVSPGMIDAAIKAADGHGIKISGRAAKEMLEAGLGAIPK